MTASIKTIIFDLDDTLLDTWNLLVTPAAREACEAMIQAGLKGGLAAVVATRSQLFSADPKGDLYANLVAALGVETGADPVAVRNAGHQAYFHREVEDHIDLCADTRALLHHLSPRYRLYLVTSGHPETQARKVSLLKIAPHFHGVHYVNRDNGERKHTVFQQILEREGHDAGHALCVGDRPDREIRAGKQLGMVTVRIRRGEFGHLEPEGTHEEADVVLNHVRELADVLARYSIQQSRGDGSTGLA